MKVTSAWQTCLTQSVDADKNKIKPNYEWAGRPITDNDYLDHLGGKKSIGIQPCRIDKTVQFGCIDIDPPDYGTFKVENYLALFQQYKLPIVPILSKSGGLHCYVFLKEPIPTIDLIEALKSFSASSRIKTNYRGFSQTERTTEG